MALAKSNGFSPSQRDVQAIAYASEQWHIDAKELTAIAIIETGIGTNKLTNVNSNNTVDLGLFQINTVNYPKCVEYNLSSPEGNAMCAAKLLHMLKVKRKDYIGAFHSKTKKYKIVYMQRINGILLANEK
jgi:hypothetical protein